MWWFDPAKESQLQQANRDSSKKLDVGAVEDKYWLEFEKARQQQPQAGN
jgi:hypothetical protein